MSAENLTNISFRFYSDILEEDTIEPVPAELVDQGKGYYKIAQSPYYVPKVAIGDVVWAEYNTTDGAMVYRKTIQYSGNSTVQVVIMDDQYDIDSIIGIFEETGCIAGKLDNRYFALSIPANVDYVPIKRRLDELEQEKILDYAEAGLSEKHQYKDYFF